MRSGVRDEMTARLFAAIAVSNRAAYGCREVEEIGINTFARA